MIQTLLLTFIHGFKGDEETFFSFPDDLQTKIQDTSPELKVHKAIYPKYETLGDLLTCSAAFREWLASQVTDLESSSNTQQAIVNPSVAVILVAHSMGGFVATDALFSILSNRPNIGGKEYMFPLIAGILTFDTPFNGLARSMFAYGAFSQYQNVSTLYNIWSSLSGGLGLSAASQAATSLAAAKVETVPGNQKARKAVRTVGGVPASSWKRWGLLAARTGTVGAVVAGGVTAYLHREAIGESLGKIDVKNIDYNPRSYLKRKNLPNLPTMPSIPRTLPSLPGLPGKEAIAKNMPDMSTLSGLSGVSRESIGEGFAWMAGHLKFVGALMKQEQMSARLGRLGGIKGVGRCNVFVCLGENGVWKGGYFVPRRRFCAVPIKLDPVLVKKGMEDDEEKKGEKKWWVENVNGKAENEIVGHCSMFQQERNDGYESLLEVSTERIVGWVVGVGVREIVDGYVPDDIRAAKSREEGEWVDDDGKVKESTAKSAEANGDGPKRKANEISGEENLVDEKEKDGAIQNENDEDENQLRAIMACQGLPLPEDGGISEEALQAAMEIPLPGEQEEVVKAAARVPLPSEEESMPETTERESSIGQEALKGLAK